MQVLHKLNIELPYDPEMLFLRVFPKHLQTRTQNKYVHTHVLSSMTHTSQTSTNR